MRSSNSSMVAARAKTSLISRDFVRISGRDRSDNSIKWLELWNDLGTVLAEILDTDTGNSAQKTFLGDGRLIAVDPITLVCEQQITDRTLSITLSSADETVNDFVRTYDLHEQRALVYQGDFDLETRGQVAPAECVWDGIVDTNPILTGAIGGEGSIVVNLRSHTTELTRVNTLKRSHASEVLRDSSDTFLQDAGTVGDWLTYLGQPTPKQIKKAI